MNPLPLTREEVEQWRMMSKGPVEEIRLLRVLELFDRAEVAERQRDAAIQQAIAEAAQHKKWTDDRTLLAKDLVDAREKGDRFKAYVHQRLDVMGVPADPEPEANAKNGCRIEGRLNWLCTQEASFLKLVDEMKDQVAWLDQKLSAARKESRAHWANFAERSGDFRKWQTAVKDLTDANARVETLRAALEPYVHAHHQEVHPGYKSWQLRVKPEQREAAIRALSSTESAPVAPDGGCFVKCPRCTRVGPHRVEGGEPILFCAQCGIGENVKVRFVICDPPGTKP